MKSLQLPFKILFISFILMSATLEVLTAQDARREATMAYNNARELVSSNDFLNGIEMYREALQLAESSDCSECGDIAELVRNQLPRVYFSRAANGFEQFRSNRSDVTLADEAVDLFLEAAEAGEEYGDDQVAQRSRAVVPQIYYNKSLAQYQQEDYAGALESLNRAIELNGNYTLAYYQRGIVLVNSDATLDEAIAAFDEAIEVGERVGDTQNVNRARERAGEELLFQGTQRIRDNQMGQAISLLNRAQGYLTESADLHYRFAEAYNNRQEYQQAIEHANRALEYESGGVTAQAKIYFELGMAYKGLEQVGNACSAFEDAAYGDFRDPAMHELEYELECEGYASRN